METGVLMCVLVSVTRYLDDVQTDPATFQQLAIFLSRISSDFATRWHEERQPECQTPIVRRLSTEMKREFVETLKTPSLFAMFSKDPICTAYAQSAIKYLSALEPAIIMPAVLEWSYNGLESVVEVQPRCITLLC